MRVTFIAGTLGLGGAERQLYLMLSVLREAGTDVRLLTLSRGESWEPAIRDLGIPIRHVGANGSRLSRMLAATREAWVTKPDVIQSQHFFTNLYAVVAARLSGAIDIGAIRSDGQAELEWNAGWIGRIQMRAPRVLAANSNAAITNLRRLGVPKRKLHLLPNVVDFQPNPPARGGRDRPVHILGVGSLKMVKRYDRFIQVIARVVGEASIPVTAEIVGDGPEREAWERMAVDLGLKGRLQFTGSLDRPGPRFENADIFLHTADREGCPNVILEAMASGLPVVATRVGGVAELVEGGRAGFVTDRDDHAGLATAIRTLAGDPSLRRAMGDAGRAFVATWHSPERLLAALNDLYRASLGHRARLLRRERPAPQRPEPGAWEPALDCLKSRRD